MTRKASDTLRSDRQRSFELKAFVERAFFSVLSGFSAIALMTIGASHGIAGPRINVTPSVPRGLYLYIPGAVKRGDIVQVCLPNSIAEYARIHGLLAHGVCPNHMEPLVKVLAAVPGDVVTVRDTAIVINGKRWPMSAIRSVDSSGRHVTMRMRAGTIVIRAKSLLLLGLNAFSWDSRYFGLLPSSAVTGRWLPLITERGLIT